MMHDGSPMPVVEVIDFLAFSQKRFHTIPKFLVITGKHKQKALPIATKMASLFIQDGGSIISVYKTWRVSYHCNDQRLISSI
jgi:hypothetical protein